MLPFQKKRQAANQTGVIMQDLTPKSEKPNDTDDFLETCVEQLIHAISMKDAKAATFALKVIFEKLDSEPHEEGPHIEPHSYDSQKLKG